MDLHTVHCRFQSRILLAVHPGLLRMTKVILETSKKLIPAVKTNDRYPSLKARDLKGLSVHDLLQILRNDIVEKTLEFAKYVVFKKNPPI